jgi:NAD(P)-dependent dehydrogenase (short-subunit alcohol dehydrogenase family)
MNADYRLQIILFWRATFRSSTMNRRRQMQTVLITGTSSGYGLETARHFLAQGWSVIATMRSPRAGLLPPSDRLRLLALDVTDPASIDAAIQAAGPIDVLVNNAGLGMVGAFEAMPMEKVRAIFETNTFGTMAMCHAAIPGMRERGKGTIVNVTSSVTLAAMPFAAAYTGSKAAIAGFTGSLAHELGAFGLRARLVEPGYAPTTNFSQNIPVPVAQMIPPAYADFAAPIFAAFANPPLTTRESDVAEAVYLAATDPTDRLHYPAGPDAVALAAA